MNRIEVELLLMDCSSSYPFLYKIIMSNPSNMGISPAAVHSTEVLLDTSQTVSTIRNMAYHPVAQINSFSCWWVDLGGIVFFNYSFEIITCNFKFLDWNFSFNVSLWTIIIIIIIITIIMETLEVTDVLIFLVQYWYHFK